MPYWQIRCHNFLIFEKLVLLYINENYWRCEKDMKINKFELRERWAAICLGKNPIGWLWRLYTSIVPYECRPGHIWYKLKCFTWHRYTTIRPKYLGHEWCDRDTLLIHCMFTILSDFLENECFGIDYIDWDEHYKKYKVRVKNKKIGEHALAIELYHWWHKEYMPFFKGKHPIQQHYYKVADEHSDILIGKDLSKIKFPNPYLTPDEKKQLEEHKDTKTYPAVFVYDSKRGKIITYKAFKELQTLEARMEKELTENLHSLVKIRHSLWT